MEGTSSISFFAKNEVSSHTQSECLTQNIFPCNSLDKRPALPAKFQKSIGFNVFVDFYY